MDGMERTRAIFIDKATEEYNNYCKAKGISSTVEGFAEYLVNRNIVQDKTINKFLVVSFYPDAMEENNGIQQLAIATLENLVGVGYSRIRVIIKDCMTSFRLKRRVIRKR